ncbi:MAG: hypothetical protein OJF49_003025 [Ktedonobacterales bacterium]|jgi:hypothetical protein|nr:MAG: hypothetical protein OJF49_003025 [Ktedonobacterales bacterium]
MVSSRNKQGRSLAIIAVGHDSSRFAARLAQVIARLYKGDPPIFAIGLYDDKPTGVVAQRHLRRVRGMRARDFSLTSAERHALRKHMGTSEEKAREGAPAVLSAKLVHRVLDEQHTLENILWIVDQPFIEACTPQIRELRHDLDGPTVTAVCLLNQPGASHDAILQHLYAWNATDPLSGRAGIATTILVDSRSPLATNGKGQYQDDMLAWGLASMLFAPLQGERNPPFSVVAQSFKDYPLTALALDISYALEAPPRRGLSGMLDSLFPFRRLRSDKVAADFRTRIQQMLSGAPATTYGTLFVPSVTPPAPDPSGGSYPSSGAPYGTPPTTWDYDPHGYAAAQPDYYAAQGQYAPPGYATVNPVAYFPDPANNGASGAYQPYQQSGAGASGSYDPNNPYGASGSSQPYAAYPSAPRPDFPPPPAPEITESPVIVNALVPFRQRERRFQELALDLSSWLGREYHLHPPSLLRSNKPINAPRVIIAGKRNRFPTMVTILFGVNDPGRASHTGAP